MALPNHYSLLKKHSIIFENVANDEEVTHPVILLKGNIESVETTCKTNNQICINKQFYQIVSNKFKCILELNFGENVFKIDYCCVSIDLRLIFKPRSSDFYVQPLYIICKDDEGEFQAPQSITNTPNSACERINVGCKLLQCIIAEKLYEVGFGRKTFNLHSCQIFNSSLSKLEIKRMKPQELWEHFGREILQSHLAADNVKFVAFLSCTRYNANSFTDDCKTHEDLVRITDGYVALGGGGLALFGTASLFTWPERVVDVIASFQNEERIDKKSFLDDSAYRGTYGASFSTTLGSVLHEVCHTFDLGHTELGIMGRGFDNIRQIFLLDEKQIRKTLTKRTSFDTQDNIVNIKVKEAETRSFIRQASFSNDIMNKTVCIDDTFFTKSSAYILAYHRWFNDFGADKKFILTYDADINFIKSTIGIRVVEIRLNPDEKVASSWCFGGKILKYNFQVSEECLKQLQGRKYTLFVEDNNGNILKEEIS